MTHTSSHPIVFLALAAVLAAWIGEECFAENIDRVVDREASRRQAALPKGDAALARGKAAMGERNFVVAHEEFRLAVNLLPDAVVGGKAHDEAVSGFCVSGIGLAEQQIAEAKYAEAEAICREMLGDRYDPNFRPAAELLARLQEPGYFNRTLGPKFLSKVEEVKKLLSDADGYYNSGRYDLAFKKYEQVLNLDPYNMAARRGEEKINLTKTHYGEEAYNETRSRQLWQVQKGWEEPVRPYAQTVGANTDTFTKDATGTARITHKLNTIVIPRIEFRDASVREAIEFLRQQAETNDPAPDGRKGVDIVLRLTTLGHPGETVTTSATTTADSPASPASHAPSDATAPAASPAPATIIQPLSTSLADARITITLNEVPLAEALRYIASQANLKVKVEPYAVLIIPVSEQSSELFTKRYRVPAAFFGGPLDVGYYLAKEDSTVRAENGSQENPALLAGKVIDKSNAAFQSSTGGGDFKTSLSQQGTSTTRQQLFGARQLVARATARDMLETMGVGFPPGSSAIFLPQSGMLIVRNTADNLDMVDALVEQANTSTPKQVEIEAKFVEITQNNAKELGFDWLLGPFRFGGNGQLQGNGGTSGTGTRISQSDYPASITGLNPITAGNRSGSIAINNSVIDSLLAGGGVQSVAPGIFGLSGLLTDPQFQVVIRALNQKKGAICFRRLVLQPRVGNGP